MSTLDDILEELKSQRSKQKDFWDRLGRFRRLFLQWFLVPPASGSRTVTTWRKVQTAIGRTPKSRSKSERGACP